MARSGSWLPHSGQCLWSGFCLAPQFGQTARILPFFFSAAGTAALPLQSGQALPVDHAGAVALHALGHVRLGCLARGPAGTAARLALHVGGLLHEPAALAGGALAELVVLALDIAGAAAFFAFGFFIGFGTLSRRASRPMSRVAAATSP